MRGQHANLPEVLVEMRLIVIELIAQSLQVAVELVEVAALIAAVVIILGKAS